ncbi:MAG: response regulator [Bacteroidales bacterium]|nr:response regulator [Bacteroidales bacterium]
MAAITNQPCILIVDDSSTNIALMEAVLEDKGYQIIKAQNVQDAFLSIKRKTPDLILLDLLIPKTSGFDFFEQLRKEKKIRDIPVIVISALSDKGSENKALEMGALDFIRKPVDIQYLIKRVESVFK